MSAELLREAAQQMRTLADLPYDVDEERWFRLPDKAPFTLWDHFASGFPDDAAHMVAWSPDVARAVADWLDALASQVRSHEWSKPPFSQSPGLAVARSFLRRQS